MRSCRLGSGGSYLAALRPQPMRFEEYLEQYRLRPSSVADLVAGAAAAKVTTKAITDRTFTVIGGIDGFVDS